MSPRTPPGMAVMFWFAMTTWGLPWLFRRGDVQTMGCYESFVELLLSAWPVGSAFTCAGCPLNGMLQTKTAGRGSPGKSARRVEVFTKEEVRRQHERLKHSPIAEQIERRGEKRSRSPAERSRVLLSPSLRGLIRVHQKKRKRAMERKKRYEQRLRASLGEKSLLEMASIKEPQRKDYARRLEGFYSFIIKHELPIGSEKELDAALCEFADHLFLDGEDLSWGQKLQAAIEYKRPEYARDGRLSLPRFKRAMKGWRQKAPRKQGCRCQSF